MTILIEGATIVIDPLAGEIAAGQSVAVAGDTIAAVGPRDELREHYPQAQRLSADGTFVLPGLIDAHTHMYSALTLGMPVYGEPPHTFPEVLERIWWRFDKRLTVEDNRISALVGGVASLRSGITTIIDHHASPTAVPDSLSQVAASVQQVGLRACLAYEVSDRDGHLSRDQGIAENRRFIREAKRCGGRCLTGLFGLHAVYSLSDETLRRCAGEAADLDAGVHMHLAEHRPEVARFAQTHSVSIAEFLHEIGVLGPKSIMAHTVHVSDVDISLLRETRTFNVHNPKSNMGNGVGVAPLVKMFQLGQAVGLGSDGFYDIPQELTTARLLQTLEARDASAFSDEMALQMVYGHNVAFAERLFDCRLGKVASGFAADLIAVRYEPLTPLDGSSAASHIMAALNSGVQSAVVAGRVVLQDGVVLGVDEAELKVRAAEQSAQLWARMRDE